MSVAPTSSSLPTTCDNIIHSDAFPEPMGGSVDFDSGTASLHFLIKDPSRPHAKPRRIIVTEISDAKTIMAARSNNTPFTARIERDPNELFARLVSNSITI